jgi:uncharacterized protein
VISQIIRHNAKKFSQKLKINPRRFFIGNPKEQHGMAELGKFNTLAVVKRVKFGAYLDGGELGEILLPRRYVPEHCQVGDKLDVFLFLDSEDKMIATTQQPHAGIDGVAWLTVVAVNKFGAFLDWGLPKDLLAPYSEQQQRMKVGQSYLVYIYLDKASQRMVASSRLEKFIGKQPIDVKKGRRVNLVIGDRTRIGYKAVINNRSWGVLYSNEMFQTLHKGQKVQGFVKNIREDGKIDLTLQKPGHDKVSPVAEKILETLRAHDGFLAVTDKSPAHRIYSLFGVSKKTFKKAIGTLYKARRITIAKNGIAFPPQKK